MCPVCLPRLNPGAFLHAYIAFLHPASGLAVALLSAAPDTFMPLSKGRAVLEAQLNQHGVTAVRGLPMTPYKGSTTGFSCPHRSRTCSNQPRCGAGICEQALTVK
jgi:hypothetical protein